MWSGLSEINICLSETIDEVIVLRKTTLPSAITFTSIEPRPILFGTKCNSEETLFPFVNAPKSIGPRFFTAIPSATTSCAEAFCTL